MPPPRRWPSGSRRSGPGCPYRRSTRRRELPLPMSPSRPAGSPVCAGARQCHRAGLRRYRGHVVSLDDVARMAAELPEVTEGERHGNRTWFIGGKAFAWVRPFSKADLKRFGPTTPPEGPIVAVRLADLADKEAVLSAGPRGFFTIPHFDGYAAVLIQLVTAGTY